VIALMLSDVLMPLAICAQLTRAVSRAANLAEIYDVALDALEAGLGVKRAAILLFDASDVMRFTAWRGLSDAYRAAVEGHSPWPARTRGAEPLIISDVSVEPTLAAYLPVLGAEQIGALAFIPLEAAEGVIGKFMLYFAEPRGLAADELQLAGVIAAQIAFAVERARASQLAAATEERLRRLASIVESSGDAIVSKTLDGVITSWNDGAEHLFGYDASEAIGQSIMLIVPHDLRAEEEGVLASIRAGRPVEIETARRHKNGSVVFVSVKISPVRDATGRITGASKIARDITPRKRYEAERTELQRRLTLLVEASASLLDTPETESVRSATLGLARQLLIADGYAMWASDAEHGAWHIVRSEGVSAHFASRVIASHRGGAAPSATPFHGPLAVPDVSAQSLLDEQLAAYEDEGIRSMLVCPMRLGGGRTGTLVFYYRYQREFREMDVQTAQALANLAAAAMTTASAYLSAHEANRLKDDFLATLSHELRTPLNAVLGYAQMLDSGMLPPVRRTNAISVVTRNAEALKQIIDDILDVSRITSGKLRLNVQTVDLDEILSNATATIQPAAEAKGVTLQTMLEADGASVTGDPDRLQQVVWNLLSNAVKFTGPGGRIELRLARVESSIQIIISDNGLGIEPAFLPHIFERFRQADSRFSREHGGLGLGLAIVRELVELHGGSVSAASQGTGMGATFTVRLPAAIAVSAALPRAQSG
jgi:PAS domain S-box-containing protein